jgi:hypothetical protein
MSKTTRHFEPCIACANGNDLADGDECLACGRGAMEPIVPRQNPKSDRPMSLSEAVRKARGGDAPVPKRGYA